MDINCDVLNDGMLDCNEESTCVGIDDKGDGSAMLGALDIISSDGLALGSSDVSLRDSADDTAVVIRVVILD